MDHPVSRDTLLLALTRRRMIAALGAIGLGGGTSGVAVARQATPQPARGGTPVATVTMDREEVMPDWRFALVALQDPFDGEVIRPDAVPQGIRVLTAEVVLANESDQPMAFSVADIRLRDVDSIEYRGGEYVGAGARLASQNLPPGERARGWVWFGIPAASQPDRVVFMAPSPMLSIRLG